MCFAMKGRKGNRGKSVEQMGWLARWRVGRPQRIVGRDDVSRVFVKDNERLGITKEVR